jgi:hypothetical protein
MSATEPNPALPALQAILSNYLMHWHKLAVDASLFIATGSLTIAGFTLTASELDGRRAAVAIGLLLLVAVGGAIITRIVHRHVRTLRGMIQKIDEENGVFELGFLRSGEALYPAEWRIKHENDWLDPITALTRFASIFLPVLLALAIGLTLLFLPPGS